MFLPSPTTAKPSSESQRRSLPLRGQSRDPPMSHHCEAFLFRPARHPLTQQASNTPPPIDSTGQSTTPVRRHEPAAFLGSSHDYQFNPAPASLPQHSSHRLALF
ncbi:hypothetical protein HN51_063974 [Arachis hypogaea]